jgi:glycoprotein endo-alpha-1,2-mannosidase
MKRLMTVLLLTVLCIPLFGGCPPEDKNPEIVGVMYHHWWTPGRWSDNPPNHPYEPVLGHYDNVDPNVIRQHIAWAKAHGINTFLLNFWITDRDWWWVQRNTDAVADICDQEGMNYFFLMDGWFEFESEPNQAYEIASRVNARAAPYFNRPGYLKQDGKPILFFWAAYPSSCDLWYDVRPGIEGTSGPIYMTGDKWDCFDLRMLYNPYISTCSTYSCQIDRQKDLWKDRRDEGAPWAPTAMPGYDDHQVRPGNPVIPLDTDFFRDSIKAAMDYDQNHSDDKRWLFINSWSEWHEGSQIEPSSNFANPLAFLEVLKQELDALK